MPAQVVFVVLLIACLMNSGCSQFAAPGDSSLATGPGAPRRLRCEYLVNPLGIDRTSPRLSWELVDSRRGAMQRAYHILVADSPDLLTRGIGNLWDTGKVASEETIQIAYSGRPLRSRTHAYWKVRVWDSQNVASPWSESAHWSMGLLDAHDWGAKWIGDAAAPPKVSPAHNGYHSELEDSPDSAKWIAIDLGQPRTLDALKLFPAHPFNWFKDVPGFLFPVRFKLELANEPDFSDAKAVVDHTTEDIPNPGGAPQTYPFPFTAARYARLTATTLAERSEKKYGLALAELQLISAGKNVAVGTKVTALDSKEAFGWSRDRLVDDDLVSHSIIGMDALPAAMLRREFAVSADDGAITRATAYVTALGIYELRINGERVGDHLLAPEWTDYNKRLQYQTYDVTALIREGKNAVAALLGDGWYAGRIGLAQIQPDGRIRALYGRTPRLFMRLDIERSGQPTQVIVTDGAWRCTTDGPVRVGDILDGETYDARHAMVGWDQAGFDDSGWSGAGVFEPPHARLVAQPNEPIREFRAITPVKLSEPTPGVFIFDIGQNISGWCRFKATATPGTTVTLRHAEMLNPDGTLYTENLRTARQTDRYTFRGMTEETFEPHFTYHGFRYVEVTGLPHKPTLETITARVVHSGLRDTGRFACSSELVNRIAGNIVWTQRANMMGIPTDCPQRDERLGWMGDILAFAQTGCFNMDLAAMFTKWLADVRDAQADNGRFADFAPDPFDPNAQFSGVPAWGDAGVFVPWTAYVNYGDTRILEASYPACRRWLEFIRSRNPDLLWKNDRGNDYGDWLNADTLRLEGWPKEGAEIPKEVFATAFFARSTEIVARMAAVLRREDEARHYATLAADIRRAFNKAYVAADGRIQGNTQAGYALALQFDLLPGACRSAAREHMLEGFKTYGGRISTGFHSTICLMQQLTDGGRVHDAYRLINNREMPSWGYAIDHGATTIWERWDGFVEGRGFQDPVMNSFSHYAIGSVGEWIFRCIGGINPDESQPGYRHILIRPRPGGGLTWARTTYDSIRGPISTAWKIERHTFSLNVTIPPNTTATVWIPASRVADVTEGRRAAAHSPGVRFVRMDRENAVFEIESGDYAFVAHHTPSGAGE